MKLVELIRSVIDGEVVELGQYEVLVSKVLKEITGDDGYVGRFGGDEFMIVLTNKKYDFCMRLLKTWYPTVGVLNRTEDGFKCVLSYGIAEGKRGSSFDELEKLADDNMYEMKVRVKKEFGEEMR